MIDKYKLLEALRYSNKWQWNKPCPEWVFKKIEAMEDVIYEDAIDRYEALAILDPLSVEYKEMRALPPVQPKIPTAQPEVRTQMPSADCISRQEVNRLIDEILENDNLQASPAVWYCLHRLKGLASAQPETAKRIVGKSKGGVTLWYECDMCNEPVDAQDNFCPRCGRRLTDE